MYIRIRSKKGKTGLCLLLPLSTLKSRFVVRLLFKSVCNHLVESDCEYAGVSSSDGEVVTSVPAATITGGQACESLRQGSENAVKFPTREQLTVLYQAILGTVKAYGHFDLVRMRSSDGDSVRIRI